MTLYVVYSQFCDDPSVLYGIFTSENMAKVAVEDIKETDKYAAVSYEIVESDELIRKGVVLE